MKLLTLCLALSFLLPGYSFAVGFKVTGKNGEVLLSQNSEVPLPITVGKLTVETLKANSIAFIGDEDAISSIGNLDQEMLVISDTETKAYGWCYSVDGVEPNAMPDELNVINQQSVVEWYYGYAHYKDGAWIAQCKRE